MNPEEQPCRMCGEEIPTTVRRCSNESCQFYPRRTLAIIGTSVVLVGIGISIVSNLLGIFIVMIGIAILVEAYFAKPT